MNVCQIRLRHLQGDLEYWMAAVGVDISDRSPMAHLFHLYAAIFFAAWAIAVLSLFASTFTPLVASTGLAITTLLAATASAGTIVWAAGTTYTALRISPFRFSEQDVHFVGIQPAEPRDVAFAWFLGPWPTKAIPVWAVAILLGFLRAEAGPSSRLILEQLGTHLAWALQCLAIVAPLHLGLMAGIWALGTLRLRRTTVIPRLPLVAVACALGIVLLAAAKGVAGPGPLEWLAGLLLPAFVRALLVRGLAVSLAVALLGLVALGASGSSMSILRVAQEADTWRRAPRLTSAGIGAAGGPLRFLLTIPRSSPEPTWATSGAGVLWKDLLQAARARGPSAAWLSYLVLTIAVQLAPDWSTRSWLIVFWLLQVGSLAVGSLRHDLGKWWIVRQLPCDPRTLVIADVARAWFGMATIAALGTAVLSMLHVRLDGTLTATLLALLASAPFAAAFDVLARCRTERLLVGSVPELGWRYVLIGAGAALLAYVTVQFVLTPIGAYPAVVVAGLVTQAVVGWGFLEASGRRLRQVQ